MPQSILPFTSMELGEIATTAKDTSFIVDKAPVSELSALLHRVNTRIKETTTHVESLSGYKYLVSPDGTAQSNADKARDEEYELTRFHIDGLRNNRNEKISSAAKRIYSIFQKHDLSTPKLAYAVATHNYYALLLELGLGENAEDVQTIDIADAIALLARANDDFVQIHRVLNGGKTEPGYPEIETYTVVLNKAINQVVTMLEALVVEDPNHYKGIADEVAVLLQEARSKVHARKTRKENSKDNAAELNDSSKS